MRGIAMQADSTAPTQNTKPMQSDAELQAQLLGFPLHRKQPSFSTWLNRIFLIVVLVTIPLIYLFGYIGRDWLNRLGIIFNFLAGFLVAPELIGIRRTNQLISNRGYVKIVLE
jgi:hypothetical protein